MLTSLAMTIEELVSGTVFPYPYLWAHQAKRGETEGRKERPVVVGIRLAPKYGENRVMLLPITTKPPEAGRRAVEIPNSEKRRAGLDQGLRLWVILDDINIDRPGRSYYITSARPLGRFSRAWFLPVIREFVMNRLDLGVTDRTL